MTKLILALICVTNFGAFAALDADQEPRLAKPDLKGCVDTAKDLLSSNEYDDKDEEMAILAACRNVDANCVRVVGNNLVSSERASAAKFLPLIESCRGPGMGDCYAMAISKMPSFDYRDAPQAHAILKKCE